MAIGNKSQYRSSTRAVRAMAYQALKATPVTPWLEKVFWIIQSNSIEEIIHFLRGVPKMREWVGERKIRSMAMASFRITKKDWEATVALERDDILFDKLGLVKPNIQVMGQAYPRHFIDLFIWLLLAGFSKPGYDGQYFFDVDHDRGDGVSMSNRSANVFSEAAWIIARAAPAQLQDPDSAAGSGDYLEVGYDTIFFGQKAWVRVNEVFNLDEHADQSKNPYFGMIKKENQIELKGLGDSEKWFLFDTSSPLKPFIFQIVKAIDFIAKDAPDDDEMFYRKQSVYGIDSIDNAQFALWELAYGGLGGEAVPVIAPLGM